MANRRSLGENERDAAYEYLCRLEEAKKWMEGVIGETLPSSTEFENSLSNGVYLCKLGMKLLPDEAQWKRVYDLDQNKYHLKGLDFRHTDNINFFLNCLPQLGLPKVFYPGVTDIFEKKNILKLIYCLHALSHLLCKKGKTEVAVTGYVVSPHYDDTVLNQATVALRSGNLPSFEMVESLVDEELQYELIGITDKEYIDEEESTKPVATPNPIMNGQSHDQSHDTEELGNKEGKNNDEATNLFDDPTYILISGNGTLIKEESDETGFKVPFSSSVVHPIVSNLKCQGAGITASLYNGFKKQNKGISNEFNEALAHINKCITGTNAKETLKALQNPEANLPFPYLEAIDYHSALLQERMEGLPSNLTILYIGLQRSLCETLLDKMRPGAYLLRQSTTLRNGEIVFSFRNQVGIKHWKLSINQDGKFSWGMAQNLFESMESFLQYFIDALGRVTKLYIYAGSTFMLKLNIGALTSNQLTQLNELRGNDDGLSYGQIACTITEVNSRIRRRRASTRDLQTVESCHNNMTPTSCPIGDETLPMVKLNQQMIDDDPWDMSMIIKTSRQTADEILEKEGYPGSFLVRPSERVSGDYALAFRTRTEIRHWKIVKSNGKYYVHPRPNPYDSVAAIILHFRDAVGAETGLVMTPYCVNKQTNKTPSSQMSPVDSPERPVITPRVMKTDTFDSNTDKFKSATIGYMEKPPPPPPRIGRLQSLKREGVKPTPSLSRLNPANITSWSVDDVCYWLFQQGLGSVVENFRSNCVDGECLLTLDNNLLKNDLKVSQLGYRSRILKRVDSLRRRQFVNK